MTEKIFKADSTSEKVPLASPKILKREVFEASREARDIVALNAGAALYASGIRSWHEPTNAPMN